MLTGQCFPIDHDYADNGIVTTAFCNTLFPFKFGNPVVIARIRLIFFYIQPVSSAIKHKIGGKVYKTTSILFAGTRQMFYRSDIGSTRLVMMCFAEVWY